MKKSVFLILVAVFMIGLDACNKKSNDGTTPSTSGLVGTWTRMYQGQTLTININADGTTAGTWGSIALPSGTYTTSGNNLNIQDVECNFLGRYTYALGNNTVTLTLVADTCDGRYQMVPGTYNRQ